MGSWAFHMIGNTVPLLTLWYYAEPPEMSTYSPKTSSKTTWAGTKWSDTKWMSDPMKNLLLTLVTTNLDFPDVQFNHFLGKYSSGKKNIQRLQRDIDFSQLIQSYLGKTNVKGVKWTNVKEARRLRHRAAIAPHTRILFSGLLLSKMKHVSWNSEITHLSVIHF